MISASGFARLRRGRVNKQNNAAGPRHVSCVSIILLRSNPMMNHHREQNIYNENHDPGMVVAFKYLNAYFSVTAQTESVTARQ